MRTFDAPNVTLPHRETQRRVQVFREALAEMPVEFQEAFKHARYALAQKMISADDITSLNYSDAVWAAVIMQFA